MMSRKDYTDLFERDLRLAKLSAYNQKLMAAKAELRKKQLIVQSVMNGGKMPLWLKVKLYFMEG